MRRAFMRWRGLLGGVLLCLATAAAVAVAAAEQPAAVVASTPPPAVQTPVEHRRGLEQTLLTYPEWFLVFSPHEYGEFLAHGAPSAFPFYGHIGQFWQGYWQVAQESWRRKLDPNPGYHLMILVIGTSTTVEYALKSAYETLIGRLAEATASGPTPEERYATQVAQDYVRFIRVRPWYEYDFGQALRGLWHTVPLTGPDLLRKWERRFALSTEYLVKLGYAKLIGLGTAGVYDPALPTTAVVLRAAPVASAALPGLQLLQPLAQGAALVSLPRYEAFMTYAQALADQGNAFEEIAGNRDFILVSVLAGEPWVAREGPIEILSQPILTRPAIHRHLLAVPVAELAAALRSWKQSRLEIEHIFDY